MAVRSVKKASLKSCHFLLCNTKSFEARLEGKIPSTSHLSGLGRERPHVTWAAYTFGQNLNLTVNLPLSCARVEGMNHFKWLASFYFQARFWWKGRRDGPCEVLIVRFDLLKTACRGKSTVQ